MDVASGTTRTIRITGEKPSARQPAWSPNGRRIAFRGNSVAGRAAIWTVAVEGGAATVLSPSDADAWLPAWSPDGRYVYCSSDRDGRLNLWRIPVDERTGERTAEPERIAAPAAQATYLSVAADGRHIAYTSLTVQSNVQKLAFDLEDVTASPSGQLLTQGSRFWERVDVSPDGKSLALVSGVTTRMNDVFVMQTDGSGLRPVTSTGRNRVATWLPDGKTLIFNESGTIKSVGTDGSGLTTRAVGDQGFILAPDGARGLWHRHTTMETALFVVDLRTVPSPPAEQAGVVTLAGGFEPTSWSPDGQRIAAHINAEPGGLMVYTLAPRATVRITDQGNWARWLPDGRRLLYQVGRALFVVDTVTKAAHEVLSVSPDYLQQYAVSPDGRWLYLLRGPREADIWLATLK